MPAHSDVLERPLPSPPPPPQRRKLPRIGFEFTAPSIWAVCVAFLVILPVAGLTWTSLQVEGGGIGIDNYVDVLSRPEILEAIKNSFVIAFGSTIGSLAISLPFAFLVSRTDMPGRHFFRSVAVLTFAAPGFIAAMGWILLLGPRGGLLNQYVITPLGLPPFDIFSPQGVILVLVLFLYPLVFLPIADALDNMDNRLEEAAESQGASRWTVLTRITFPLIIPPIFSGSLLVFISAFVIFGPVALLGGPVGFQTIPTAMYQLMTFPPRIEYAAVLGVPVLLVLAALLVIQRKLFGKKKFTTVGGKPGQRRTLELGAWKIPAFLFGAVLLLFSIVLPFGVLLLTSFRKAIGVPLSADNFVLLDNYRALIEQPEILRSFVNSLVIALLATVVAIAIAILGAWLAQRSNFRARATISPLMLAPLAFPGAILGIAMVITYAGSPFWMGGTLTIMAIAYLIRVLPQCFTYVDAGLRQVSVETEEASRNLGASWLETMRRITIPLLRGPILSVGILSFVLLFRELDISIFLYSGSNTVAPVVLYHLASESQFQLMGALAVVMLAVNLGVVLVARKLLGVKVAA